MPAIINHIVISGLRSLHTRQAARLAELRRHLDSIKGVGNLPAQLALLEIIHATKAYQRALGKTLDRQTNPACPLADSLPEHLEDV